MQDPRLTQDINDLIAQIQEVLDEYDLKVRRLVEQRRDVIKIFTGEVESLEVERMKANAHERLYGTQV